MVYPGSSTRPIYYGVHAIPVVPHTVYGTPSSPGYTLPSLAVLGMPVPLAVLGMPVPLAVLGMSVPLAVLRCLSV